MWANSLYIKSNSRTQHNLNSEKYIITCQDRIRSDNPTTNEWLNIVGALKKTNQRDLNRVLKGILDKKKTVAIKISKNESLQKEYTIATLLQDIPGFLRPYCFFQCEDDFKEHPSASRTSLCRGPGTSMKVLVMPYFDEGSMRDFNWVSKPDALIACLLQLFCSLMQAYESKGILHSDTHLDNVLLKKTTVTSVDYILGGKRVSVPTGGYFITIMDFELSFNEVSSNRGRAIGQLYDDLLHSISDLRYESKVEIHDDDLLMKLLMDLKIKPIPVFEALKQIYPLIQKINISSKMTRSFVYDPSIFG